MKVLMWLAVAAALAPRPAASDLAAARSHMLAGDLAAAAAEFAVLAQRGDAEAQASLARMYFTGRGIERDQEAALRWFGRAAAGGHVASQVHLGMISAQAQNFEASAKWLTMAAEAGDAGGMTNLAALYLRGLGVEQDPVRALHWLAKAAGQGDPVDQLELGQLYLDGGAGEPDVGLGLRWIRRAADQGYVEAQNRLGAIHAEGVVVARDPVRAYMWFHRSSMMGTERAGERLTALAGEMTPAQIAEAKRLADAWRPGTK
jgi:TPR repeat protein